jgi:RHS repeat-associated protein
LYIEQTPYQDWEQIYDGCGSDNDIGSEIRVNYAYNAFGSVRYTSVPQLIARSSYQEYDIDWTIAKTQMTYDTLGRVYDTVAPNGETTNTRYSGRITAVAAIGRDGDVDRHLSWTMVNGLGFPRLLRVYEKSGTTWYARAQVMLSPNVVGNVTQIILPGGVGTSTLEYNLVGQKTRQVDPDLGTWSYGYNRHGNLIEQVDGRGQRSCFYYDNVGRLGTKYVVNTTDCPDLPPNPSDPPPPTVTLRVVYGYDHAGTTTNPGHRGQLTAVESNYFANSVATEFIYRQEYYYNNLGLWTYDEMTLLSTGSTTDEWTTIYTYDSYNRPLGVVYPDGSRVRTDYNSMGLPKSLCDATSHNACTLSFLVNNVVYDELGRITSMNLPASGNFVRTYAYHSWGVGAVDGNGNKRLWKTLVTQSGTTHLALEYKYDSFGNVTELKDGIGASFQQLTYDYRNRLTRAQGLSTAWHAATARPIEIENRDHTYGTRPMAPDTLDSYEFEWNAMGYMTRREFKNSSGVKVHQDLQWDQENHLKSIGPNGYSQPRTEEYRYTTDGRRLRKKVTTTSTLLYFNPNQYFLDSTGGLSIRYYYLGNMRIAERHNSSSAHAIYSHGDQVDSTVFTTNNGTNKSRRYYAYGLPRSGSIDTAYGYTNQWEDSTGLIYMKARYYDPNLGLFISPDTIIPDPTNVLDYNRYAYARGNPVSMNDPTGHCPAPPEGSGSTICVALFIEPETVSPGGITVQGDGRTFSNNSDPSQSRGYLWIHTESGKISWQMNPTRYVVAASDDSLPSAATGWGPPFGSPILAGAGSGEMVIRVSPSADNQWTVIPGENGEFLVQYQLPIAGILESVSPAIHGSLVFYPDGDGGYQAVGRRDGFPWAEAYFHNGQGDVQTIFQDPAIRGNPHDLYAIEPGMRLGQMPGYALGFPVFGPPQSSVLWPYSE